MSAGKTIALIASGLLIILACILLVLGALFIWSTGSTANTDPQRSMTIGIITVAVGIVPLILGIVLVWIGLRKGPAPIVQQNVTMKVDLPGDMKSETLKCQSCGGTLGPDDVKLVAGAPWVVCPYCKTTYQLTEDPKW